MVYHYILINLINGVFFYGQTEEHRKDDRHKDSVYTKLIASWKVQGHKYHTIWFEIPKKGTHLDKLIHPKIDVLPIVKPNSNRGNNECFQLNSIKDIEIIKYADYNPEYGESYYMTFLRVQPFWNKIP